MRRWCPRPANDADAEAEPFAALPRCRRVLIIDRGARWDAFGFADASRPGRFLTLAPRLLGLRMSRAAHTHVAEEVSAALRSLHQAYTTVPQAFFAWLPYAREVTMIAVQVRRSRRHEQRWCARGHTLAEPSDPCVRLGGTTVRMWTAYGQRVGAREGKPLLDSDRWMASDGASAGNRAGREMGSCEAAFTCPSESRAGGATKKENFPSTCKFARISALIGRERAVHSAKCLLALCP